MSTAELKEAANKLSPNEQNFLHAYLGLKRRLQDPAFLTELSRRDREMAAGDYLTSEQVRERHLLGSVGLNDDPVGHIQAPKPPSEQRRGQRRTQRLEADLD